MRLTDADRASLAALLPHLGPDSDPEPILAFVRDHWLDLHACLGEQPGDERVRAALIRVAPLVLSEVDALSALEAAREALEGYPAAVAEGDLLLTVERHPAWVGLAALELATVAPTLFPRGVAGAVALAKVGFAALAGPDPAGDGEVLWAMAEQAEEVGWTDRARTLMEAATQAAFSDPAQRERVKLLRAHQLADDGEDEAAAQLLLEVSDSDEADDEERVHALLVLAELRERAGDVPRARGHLREAYDELVSQGDDERAERVRAALDDISDSADPEADA